VPVSGLGDTRNAFAVAFTLVRRVLALAIMSTVMFAACGSDSGGDEPAGTAAPSTVTPGNTVLVDGLQLEVYNCVMDKWNAVVDEWNTLTAKRDADGAANVIVDGVEYAAFAEWATAKGHPTTFDDIEADPQVVADCGG
jgi:hypothetical protein